MYESVFDDKKKEPMVRCEYCGKAIEPDKVYLYEIYINGGKKDMKFCSKDCAHYRQMGAEG